jgi:hypothetical protein
VNEVLVYVDVVKVARSYQLHMFLVCDARLKFKWLNLGSPSQKDAALPLNVERVQGRDQSGGTWISLGL